MVEIYEFKTIEKAEQYFEAWGREGFCWVDNTPLNEIPVRELIENRHEIFRENGGKQLFFAVYEDGLTIGFLTNKDLKKLRKAIPNLGKVVRVI